MSDNAQHLHTALCAYTNFLTNTPEVFPVGVPYNMYPPICRTYAHIAFLYIYNAHIAFLYIYTNRLYMSYPAAVSGHIDVDIMSHRYRIPNYYLCYLNP